MKQGELKAYIYKINKLEHQYLAVENFIQSMQKIDLKRNTPKTPSYTYGYYYRSKRPYENYNRKALQGNLTTDQLQRILTLWQQGVAKAKGTKLADIEPYNLIADSLIQYHLKELTINQKIMLAAKSFNSVTLNRVVNELNGKIQDLPSWDNFAIQVFNSYKGVKKLEISVRQLKLILNQISRYQDLSENFINVQLSAEQANDVWDAVIKLSDHQIRKSCIGFLANPEIKLDSTLSKKIASKITNPLQAFTRYRPDEMEDPEFRDSVIIEYIANLKGVDTIQKHLETISNPIKMVTLLTHKNKKVREYVKIKLSLNDSSISELRSALRILQDSSLQINWKEELGEEVYNQILQLQIQEATIIGLEPNDDV